VNLDPDFWRGKTNEGAGSNDGKRHGGRGRLAGKPEGPIAERPNVARGCRPDRRMARPTGQAIGMSEPSCARRGRRPWDSPSTSGRVGVPAR
jgi:hypothetical protein